MRLTFNLRDWQCIRRGEFEERLKAMADDTVAKIKSIEQSFDDKWKTAGDKIASLEAALTTAGVLSGPVQDALDELKAHVEGAQVPA